MTHPLTEKVAQAICESKPDRAGFWETTPEARRKGYRTQARAAVVAVLKHMRDHGVDVRGGTFARMALEETFDALLAQIEGQQ
jgi:hypothetical protein